MKTKLLNTLTFVKNHSKIVLLVLLGTIVHNHVSAQVTVKGKISDENGKGIPHLNILVARTTSIAVTKTDEDGNYEYSSSSAPSTGVLVLGVWDCNNKIHRDTIQYATENVDYNIAGICATALGTGTTRCNVGFVKRLVTFPGTKPFTYNFTPLRIENGKHVITAESTWRYGDGTIVKGNNSTAAGPNHTYTQLEKDSIYTICFSGEFQTGCIADYCDTVLIPGTGGSSSIYNYDNFKKSIHFKHQVIENNLQFSFDLLKNNEFDIQVSDLRGVIIHQSKIKARSGFNQRSIDISSYRKGIYILNLSDGQAMINVKFIK